MLKFSFNEKIKLPFVLCYNQPVSPSLLFSLTLTAYLVPGLALGCLELHSAFVLSPGCWEDHSELTWHQPLLQSPGDTLTGHQQQSLQWPHMTTFLNICQQLSNMENI